MSGFKLNLQDTKFVLAQIKIAEAHAAGTPIPEIWVDAQGNVVPAGTTGATLAVPTPISPYGLRTVDGSYNNITPGREFWGAADQVMPRALDASFRDDGDGDFFFAGPGAPLTNTNYNGTGTVIDADPRTISNLIADMTLTNPAAIQAWQDNVLSQAKWVEQHGENAVQLFPGDAMVPNGVYVTNEDLAYIPNIAPDEGLSASFNAWMTFFGQFFDHGLDLISKGGNVGKVYIPLQPDDPLMAGDDGVLGTSDDLPPHLQFMVLTRATVAPGGGHEATNTTTPFVDQNQTYTSHASHQVFLREYVVEGGKPVATGHLLDGANGGLPTWADVKAQALMLGIQLTDGDALNIPLLRTDQYGKFIPDPTTGMAQVVVGLGLDGIPNTADDIVVSGTPGSPVNTFTAGGTGAVRIGHAFLDDINDEAAPVFNNLGQLVPDADTDTGNAQARNAQGQKQSYDNELLDRHFITGDGRGNENIGLTTVHHVFHQEHNRQVEQQKLTILASGDMAFINEWLDTDLTSLAGHPGPNATLLQLQAFGNTLNWDGERLFQAGRFATEMQYQHLVFEEFARKIQPNIDPFVFNSSPDINPAIFAEFAHVVYRFGHSMLTDNMPRIDANGNVFDGDIDLVEAFLNPVSFDHINDGNPGNDITADEAAASIVRGMTIETGNAIDEFIVDSLRNNLLGLPLDLAALNIARGRDAGVPTLNDTRTQLYAATNSSFLKPYESWVEFATNLKTPMSVVNFIAAYGKHDSIDLGPGANMAANREAAMLLVFGGPGAPADRVDFLNSTGPRWSTEATGLNDIDLWIGGLAEKVMPFGGMLGSTFNAIFEAQLENLQDGDRFYYLTRTQGQNLLVSLEQNSFIKLIMANTDLAQPGADGIRGTEDDIIARHVGVDSFAKYDFVLEVDVTKQADYTAATPGELAEANAAVAAAQAGASAATAASNAADAAVVAANAALVAAVAADTTDAAALQAAATAAAATAAALTSTTEFNALLAAVTNAGATDAAALQAAANAALALANLTDAAALQVLADAAAADDAAAVVAQALADATDAAALQADADAAVVDDQASADADADAAAAAQAVVDALAARDAAQLALDTLIANSAPQVDIDAAVVVRDLLQDGYDQAVLDSAAAVLAAQAAQLLATATDAVALQADATNAGLDDAAAAAAQALANATNASALQIAATQAGVDDAAAVTAQAAATAAAAADGGVIAAVNAYIAAVAADQAADAVAAAAAAAAATAAAQDAAVVAASAALAAAAAVASVAATTEAAAQAALVAAEDELTVLLADGSAPGRDPVGNDPVLEALGQGKVVRDNPNTPGADTNYLRFYGGEHIVAGGTNNNDIIITDFGDDGIWGDAGDDRIESGAGVDLVNGGGGNDIITDSGDTGDFLKGDEGDDVIANSNGLDIIMGGTGNDVVFVGVDDTEVFAGQGNDFVLGGAGVDLLMGNEGDDWLEGGAGFDTTAGDNSELNFDSKIIGHDVMFAGSEEHDHDGESGDDIMVEGESVVRSEGMMGFDWVIHKGVQTAANVDMGIPIFTTEQADILRDRYDKVEAASGWKFDDVLIGDDRLYDPNANLPGNVGAAAGPLFFRDEIDAAGIARISGLNQVITSDLMFQGIYGSDWSNDVKQIFSGGNVLLGGGGSDVIAGKGGNDIIDGDRWLNVRIRLTLPGAADTQANEIATVDSLQHVFGAGAPAAWVGKSLFQLMIDRVIVPDQLHIVREILNGNQVGDVDTAVFWDVRANYSITRANDGTITVSHTGFAQGAVVPVLPNTTFKPISDDTDTLRNIEVLRFGDGAGGFVNFSVGQLFPFAPTGAAIISDATPTEGQLLTVDTSTIADLNGLGPFSFQWQRSTNGNNWININGATGASFAVPDAAGTALGAVADQFLRVRVTYTDGFGDNELIVSASTTRVGANYDASGAGAGVNFAGTRGDNLIVGSNFNDTLAGREGDDIITGGRGNDTIGGGVGNDTAVFTGPLTNFAFATAGTGIQVTDRIGNEGTDSLQLIEVLRFAGVDYTVVNGSTGADANLNGATGAVGSQAIFGRQGVDSLNGGDGADILVGGGGNDTARGGNGDDYIFMTSNEGRDFVDGGADVDTFVLNGVAGAEVFNIMTRAYATTVAGITGLNANTEIVITRNGTNNGSIIAELDNIEEITINSLLTSANNGDGVVNGGANQGDTINVLGDFSVTSLNYSTIHIAGSADNDTVNISGLSSDHRVVFDSNGGSDTFIGDLRPQDVVTGIPGLTAAGLSIGGGVEDDFELMQMIQDFDVSVAQDLFQGSTIRTGLDMISLSMFGPAASQLVGAHDLLDDLSMNMPSTRLIVNDYSLV